MAFTQKRLDIKFTLASNNPGGSSFGGVPSSQSLTQQAFDAPTGTTVTAGGQSDVVGKAFDAPTGTTVTAGGGSSGSNTLTLSNLRISSKVIKAGGTSMGQLSAAVYGLTLQQMNQLSTLGMRIQLVPRNKVTLLAGDDKGNMKLVFDGNITQAYADMNSSPDVAFHIEAHIGAAEATQTIEPTSFKGGVDVATVMKGLADQAKLKFENNGVSVQIADPYYSGSAREQMANVAQHANIAWAIDDGVLSIWPKSGARNTPKIFLISPNSGLINYPAFTAQGIMLKCVYNPAIIFGGKIEVKSMLKPANGIWAVYGLEHNLDSRVHHGHWETTLQCFDPQAPAPVTK